MTVQERGVFMLAKAGVRRIHVGGQKNGSFQRVPKNAETLWTEAAPASARLRHAGRHIVRPETLKEIVAGTYVESTRFVDASGQTVLEVLVPGSAAKEMRLSPADCLAVDGAAGARRWLLNTARKSTDGFMAKNFDRTISLTVTGLVLDTPVTPNQMTLVSVSIGIIGGLCFLSGSYWTSVVGSFMVLLHSVIDGCDGELARLKFLESPWGRKLDFWGDNLVHVVLFTSMGIGLSATDPRALWLGISSSVAALGSAWLSSGDDSAIALASQGKKTAATFAEKAQVALAQRDFIYLLVALSIIGKPMIFLWAAGIGSPIFLLVTAALTAVSNIKVRKGAAS